MTHSCRIHSEPLAKSTRQHTLSLRDFLTNGSLVALCAQLTELTSVTVELRDEHDRLVVPDPQTGWKILDVNDGLPTESRQLIEPLIVRNTRIGALVAGCPACIEKPSDALSMLLPSIARAACEWCEAIVETRHTIDELGVLIELSSMLVGTDDLSIMVEHALESVLRVLDLDAGSIMLFSRDADGMVSEDERDLKLAAAIGLSNEWLTNLQSLSKNREFDRRALAGEVVSIVDLRKDDRVRDDQQVYDEGVRSFMCTGLLFQNKPVGVIRVYAKEPRIFRELDKRILRSIAQQAAAAVSQARLLAQRQHDAEIERQVVLAGQVQRRMLPKDMPDDPRVDIAARYQPSYQVGGDLYDVFPVGHKIGLMIGDVAGKGVPAAMLMSLVHASLRAHADSKSDPSQVIASVNRDMCRDTLESEFATLWYGLLDTTSGTLTFASAGHEPPIIVRADGSLEELPIGSLAAGIDPDVEYQCNTLQLMNNDLFITYTDGVTDIMNFDSQRFGKQRLLEALQRLYKEDASMSAQVAIGRINRELRNFAGMAQRPDDSTLIVIRYIGPATQYA